MRFFFLFLVSLTSVVAISGCGKKELYSNRQFLMGTVVEVISPHPEASEIVFDELRRIESIFSVYKQDSLISKLNNLGFIEYNQEITDLLKKSLEFYKFTDGRFDVTVGPLTKLWKEAINQRKIPSQKLIEERKRLVGMQKVLFTADKIELKETGMSLDFGAIAKGYAVDKAVEKLKEKKIDSAIINAGGDIYCLGSKFGQPWNVGIQHPRDKKRIIKVLKLKNKAVATSGDYEQFMEINNQRYSHIIDPQTGYPVKNDVISVTIIADSCMIADAVATSIFLLGKEIGEEKFKNMKGIEEIIVLTKHDLL